jgi:hypothetical protein
MAGHSKGSQGLKQAVVRQKKKAKMQEVFFNVIGSSA